MPTYPPPHPHTQPHTQPHTLNLQVKTNLASKFNDNWRGITEAEHHFSFFRKGTPTWEPRYDFKFLEDLRSRNVPDSTPTNPMQSQKPLTPETREKRWQKRHNWLKKIHKFIPLRFTLAHYLDCQKVLLKEKSPGAMSFNWTKEEVQ
jgi:hypothetical protein